MMEASEKMEYEEAAKYRDLIASVKQVAQKQKITADDSADRDVIACASDGTDAVCTGILYKGRKTAWPRPFPHVGCRRRRKE